jgi:hypothetical protein
VRFPGFTAQAQLHFESRGFNEVTAANGVYFHLWSGKTATVNTGANGLGMLGTHFNSDLLSPLFTLTK